MTTPMTLKDVIFILIVIFQSGLTIGIVFTNLKNAVKTIDELKVDISKVWQSCDNTRDRVSKLEGKIK